MKTIFKYFVFALLLVGFAAGSSFAAAAEYNEGEVLVVMKAPAGTYSSMSASAYAEAIETKAVSFARRKSLSTVCTYAELSQSSGHSIAFFKDAGKSTAQLIEELKNDPEVLSVSANYKRKTASLPNDPMLSKQWGLNRINVFEAWDNYDRKFGEVVYVAVLDTGVDYNHEDLRDNIARDSNGKVIGWAFYGNGTFNSPDPIDKNLNVGHGTHVAGIIGAVGNNNRGIVGVHYKNIKIVPVNVFTGDGPRDGYWDADIIRGLQYVLARKKSGLNIRVVNMSIGGWSPPPPISESKSAWEIVLQDLSDAGVIIVVAAGNDGMNISNPANSDLNGQYIFPASFWKVDNKITVGSINPLYNDKSEFSNYDTVAASLPFKPAGIRLVDMAAPGEYILSTIPGNNYEYYSGTSMAAPFVAGTAALLFSFFPEKSAADIKKAILNNTFEGRGKGQYWTHGSLNVGKAYLQFDNNPVTPITPNPLPETHPISLDISGGSSVNLVKKELQLSVHPYPNEYGQWTSRNNILAEIDQTGLLTAKSEGKVEIVYTPYVSGVSAARRVIEIRDIYDEGTLGGCNAGMTAMLAVPIALFFMTMVSRRRKK